MRGMEGDSGRRCFCCMLPSLRTGALILVATFTAGIFIWMVKEQDTVQLCMDLSRIKAARQLDGYKPPVSRSNDSSNQKWDYNWDRKAFKNPADANGVGVRTLLLIRHGQYDLSTGQLNDLGKRQANLTGMRLKALNMHYKVIIHSTMDRAMQTAQIIHRHLSHLPLVPDEDIQEGGPVPPEPTINYWSLPDRTYYVDGPRLEAAYRKYFFRADPVQKEQTFEVLVGHANIFKFFALRALQFPANAWMRVFIAHGSITLLHVNPDSTVTMSRFGDSGHFPPDMVTY